MGANLDIVLGGLVDALRQQDPALIGQLLAPDVVWEGIRPEWRCEGRRQAMELVRHRFARAPFVIEGVEAVEAGRHVVVGLSGAGFNGTPGDWVTAGHMYHVFTLCDGVVVRWRDYASRAEALAGAGVSG